MNCVGFVQAAFARKMGLGQACAVEIWAGMEGVLAAINRGWTILVLKSDSMYVASIFRIRK